MKMRLITALLLALSLAACGDEPETAVQEAVEEGTAETLVGENLTVRGQVGEVLSDQAFIINGEYFGFDGAGTLVVGAGDAPEPINEGDFVSVQGTLREFVIADVEEAYDLELDDDLLVRYEDQFAVAAESVEVIPAEAGEDDDTVVEELEEGELDPADLAVGETVTVNAGVNEPLGPHAFSIGEDGTLVLTKEPVDTPPDSVVTVTGTVREFVIVDVEEELGVDLDDELLVEYEQEVVIVADSVEVIPGVD